MWWIYGDQKSCTINEWWVTWRCVAHFLEFWLLVCLHDLDLQVWQSSVQVVIIPYESKKKKKSQFSLNTQKTECTAPSSFYINHSFHSFVFSTNFFLLKAMVDLERILGILSGGKNSLWMKRHSIEGNNLDTFTHLLTPGTWRVWRKPTLENMHKNSTPAAG